MNKDIYENELIYLSKYVGMRSDYVQAGGGNISIKISDKNMIIKSSGVQLADIHKGYGITCVDKNHKSSYKLLTFSTKYSKLV